LIIVVPLAKSADREVLVTPLTSPEPAEKKIVSRYVEFTSLLATLDVAQRRAVLLAA